MAGRRTVAAPSLKPPTGKLTRPRPGNPGHGTELTRGSQWVRDATARIMGDSARVAPCPPRRWAEPPREPRQTGRTGNANRPPASCYLWCRILFPGKPAHRRLNHVRRISDCLSAAWPTDNEWPGRVGSIIVTPVSWHATASCYTRRTHIGKCIPGPAPTAGCGWPAPRVDDARLALSWAGVHAQRRFNRDPCPKLGGADDVTQLARRSSRSLGRTREGTQRGLDGIALPAPLRLVVWRLRCKHETKRPKAGFLPAGIWSLLQPCQAMCCDVRIDTRNSALGRRDAGTTPQAMADVPCFLPAAAIV